MANPKPIENVNNREAKKEVLELMMLQHREILKQLKQKQQEQPQLKKVEVEVQKDARDQAKLQVISRDGKLTLQAVQAAKDAAKPAEPRTVRELPKSVNILGMKINLHQKVEEFKENYIKNYVLSKSPNLLIARFSELKMAFLGQLLSILGLSSEDIRKLQEKAVNSAISQNKLLFEENEYNAELIAIIGGSKKQVRAQQRAVAELRNQLMAQMKRLGLPEYYSKERLLEVQREQCQKILGKFVEEKMNLEYKISYLFGIN